MDETYDVLEVRDDGSYVILKDGSPYHVCAEYAADIWAAINAQRGIKSAT